MNVASDEERLEALEGQSGIAGVGQQDDELVAAVARDDVGVSKRRLEQLGELNESLIARLVAKRVVHGLELVEVEEQQRGTDVPSATDLQQRRSAELEPSA